MEEQEHHRKDESCFLSLGVTQTKAKSVGVQRHVPARHSWCSIKHKQPVSPHGKDGCNEGFWCCPLLSQLLARRANPPAVVMPSKTCPWGQEAPIHLSINVWRGLVSSKRGNFFGLIAAPCLHPNREHFAMASAHVPEHCGLMENAKTIAFSLKGSWTCSQIAMQTHLSASRTTVPSFSLKRHFCFVVD